MNLMTLTPVNETDVQRLLDALDDIDAAEREAHAQLSAEIKRAQALLDEIIAAA